VCTYVLTEFIFVVCGINVMFYKWPYTLTSTTDYFKISIRIVSACQPSSFPVDCISPYDMVISCTAPILMLISCLLQVQKHIILFNVLFIYA
jgi:hypothetical protein